jgi:hypothetical protein
MGFLLRDIEPYQRLFSLALRNLAVELYDVISEGMALGIVLKSTRDTLSSLGYKGDAGFSAWNRISSIDGTAYKILMPNGKMRDNSFSIVREGGVGAAYCIENVHNCTVKRMFDCEFAVDGKVAPVLCQMHRGFAEGMTGCNVDVENNMARGGEYCDFKINGMKWNGLMAIFKARLISAGEYYRLRRGSNLIPLLGIMGYVNANFEHGEEYLGRALEKAGREFASEIGIKSEKNAGESFLRTIGIQQDFLVWEDIYDNLAEKIGIVNKGETLCKLIGHLLAGFADYYGKKDEVKIGDDGKGWAVRWGDDTVLAK